MSSKRKAGELSARQGLKSASISEVSAVSGREAPGFKKPGRTAERKGQSTGRHGHMPVDGQGAHVSIYATASLPVSPLKEDAGVLQQALQTADARTLPRSSSHPQAQGPLEVAPATLALPRSHLGDSDGPQVSEHTED